MSASSWLHIEFARTRLSALLVPLYLNPPCPSPPTEDPGLPSPRWRVKIPRKEMQRVENYLKVLLQAFGAVTAMALVPFVMPRSWMVEVHEWLGMGLLPDKPVVEYLARTTSALYGFLGVLYLVLATDVRRYARIITFSAAATLILSSVNTALSLRAGMPAWWMWSDAAACWLFGLGILFLQRRADSLRKNSGPAIHRKQSGEGKAGA